MSQALLDQLVRIADVNGSCDLLGLEAGMLVQVRNGPALGS
jgi:hypothetical protein